MKSILAILLAAAMLAALPACANNSGAGANNAGSAASATESAANTDAGQAQRTLDNTPHPTQDPYGKYDPPIDVMLIHRSADGVFFLEGETMDNNVYTRRYSNDLGINYHFKWTAPFTV